MRADQETIRYTGVYGEDFEGHSYLMREVLGGYMRMITHAYAAWNRCWDDLGVKLCVDTGSLSLSARADDRQAESLRLLRAEIASIVDALTLVVVPIEDPTVGLGKQGGEGGDHGEGNGGEPDRKPR